MNKVYTVFIVDDHSIARQGLNVLLDQEPMFTVVGEAESGEEALEKIRETTPDLVIAEISLNGMSGLDLSRKLSAQRPELPVLIFTSHRNGRYRQQAREAGVREYISKDESPSVLIRAISSIFANGIFANGISANGKG